MKTLKTLFTILSVALFTISCSSDDDKEEAIKYNEENPLRCLYGRFWI